jgi:hypothetical protein
MRTRIGNEILTIKVRDIEVVLNTWGIDGIEKIIIYTKT